MTAATIRLKIAERRQADYEAYHRWENQQVLRDELTDASERISAPVDSSFHFTLTEKGLMSDINESLQKVIDDGYDEAELLAQTNPDWEIELERRGIEKQEYGHYESIARAGEGAVVTFWPVPDAVRNGTSKISGYNRDRLKMFARIGVATGNGGIKIGSLSLDGSDYWGMQAMAQGIGHELPDGKSSEDVARQSMFVSGGSLENLKEILRTRYDNSLAQQYGGEWYAGRRPIDVKDALGFIEQQPDLIEQHMQAVLEVRRSISDRTERELKMKPLRYNFAAALEARLRGEVVTSVSDAGDTARAKGETFERDCPDGAAAVGEQAQALGLGNPNSLDCVTCPFCRKIVDAKRTRQGGIMCPDRSCKMEVRGKRIIDHKKVHNAFGKIAANAAKKNHSRQQPQMAQNSNVKIISEIKFGYSRKKYINAKTGTEIKI